MTHCPTRRYGAATPIIRGQSLNDDNVGRNKHMQAINHTCFVFFKLSNKLNNTDFFLFSINIILILQVMVRDGGGNIVYE